MTTIDYSVWDHIEVSDDEDDTHPNIDTPSLFRWRHQVHTHTHTLTKLHTALSSVHRVGLLFGRF